MTPYMDPQLISVLNFLSCPQVIWAWAQRLSSRDQLLCCALEVICIFSFIFLDFFHNEYALLLWQNQQIKMAILFFWCQLQSPAVSSLNYLKANRTLHTHGQHALRQQQMLVINHTHLLDEPRHQNTYLNTAPQATLLIYQSCEMWHTPQDVTTIRSSF